MVILVFAFTAGGRPTGEGGDIKYTSISIFGLVKWKNVLNQF